MPHEGGESCQRGALHLIVRQMTSFVVEGLDLLVQLGVMQGETKLSTLGTIEAIGCDRIPTENILLTYLFDEAWVSCDDVGTKAFDRPV